jgi:serine/threonine protein kinase
VLLRGDALGHCTIVGRLGEGGMGEVFAALDTTLNRRGTLKILPPGPAEIRSGSDIWRLDFGG